MAVCPLVTRYSAHSPVIPVHSTTELELIICHHITIIMFTSKVGPPTVAAKPIRASTTRSSSLNNGSATPPMKQYVSSASATDTSASVDAFLTKRLAERMQSIVNSTLIDSKNNIYQLKWRPGQRFPAVSNIAKYYIGRKPVGKVDEKVLMIVGATGAGKSTLINAIVNYLFGVQWDDPFRFKLIVEQPTSQVNSVTRTTAYTIYWHEGSPCAYTLTIIDTPGFGDTSGLKRDKEIMKQIKEFFSVPCTDGGIDHLDGIGFVTQASQARLTHVQKYIFDAILTIFGHDIANNIFMMITFADGQKPSVLDAIKAYNVPYAKHFKFNNSALFPTVTSMKEDDEEQDDDDDDGDFDFKKNFWDMGTKNLENFFKSFEAVQPCSLQLTREVLEERQRLETNVNGLQLQISQAFAKIEEVRTERKTIKDHEADIEANKEFKYKVKWIEQRKVYTPAKSYVTDCLTCNRTCHKSCIYSNDKDKYRCSAMDGEGPKNAACTVCPEKCTWKQHVNNSYYFEFSYEEERTHQELKKKFDAAQQGKSMAEQMLQESECRLAQLDELVMNMIQQIQQSINRLGEIALRPNPLSEVEYIELMIESEKAEAKPGWKKRVEYLDKIMTNMMN